ncbi:MAG: hypothetical protein IT440_15375, partial [Phycisphaeraceae bacterium]|nr:hypothetical protein [Phycisphaeraceae bacterium]
MSKQLILSVVFAVSGFYSFGQTCTPFVFTANGLIHKPTPQNPLKLYQFGNLFPAVFNNTSFLTKITLEIDVKHGGWQPDTMNNNVNGGTLGSRHCIFLMTRNRYISNTFGQLMFRGPGKNNFHMEHNIDNDPTEYSGPVNSWNAYQAGDTYRFHYVYDARNDQVQLKIYDITGPLLANPQLVRTVTDTTTLNKVPPCNRQNTVNNKDNDPDGFDVQFGFPNVRVYGYEQWVPTYDWEYSNFKLTVENECTTMNANAGPNKQICLGTPVTLNGSGGTQYSWSPALGLSNPNIANPLANPAAATTYTLTVTDSLDVMVCTDIDSVKVSVNTSPVVNAGNDVSVCPGTAVSLSGSGAATYTWTADPTLSNTAIADPVATPINTTSYVLTGSNGTCQDKDTVVVTLHAVPTANAGADISICAGDSAALQASGGTTFTWSPPLGLSAVNVFDPTAFPQNPTTYTVTVSNAYGCTDMDEILVDVSSPLIASAGADVSICVGDSVVLQANGGTSFSWAPPLGLSSTNISNPTAFPQSTTPYSVVVSNSFGCTDADTVTVFLFTLPNVNAGNDVSVCPGMSASLAGSGATGYAWNADPTLSDTSVANPLASPTATTFYVLTGSSGSCANSDTVVVSLYNLPVANAGTDASVCSGDSIQLQASGGNSFVWAPPVSLSVPNAADPFASPLNATAYTVTVTDANGCTAKDEVMIGLFPLPAVSLGAD